MALRAADCRGAGAPPVEACLWADRCARPLRRGRGSAGRGARV